VTVTPATPGDLAAIVSKLRAAGCVFAEDEARLLTDTARSAADLAAMVDRRVSGHPLEHVLGWAEFCGLRIAITDGVFVPRRRSEFLVRQAVAVALSAAAVAAPAGQESMAGLPGPQHQRPVIVDLCCGSGAIGVAVVSALGSAELHAADIDAAAVACARQNVAPIGGQVYQGDLYDPLPARLRGRVDVLVVNAPYVPTGEIALMPPEARLHEPPIALDGGSDGVDVHRRVAGAASGWLARDGRLLIETSDRQAATTAAAMTASGIVPVITRDDDCDATVVIGSRGPVPGTPPRAGAAARTRSGRSGSAAPTAGPRRGAATAGRPPRRARRTRPDTP
jgi:release factor glutamine methyltransferase